MGRRSSPIEGIPNELLAEIFNQCTPFLPDWQLTNTKAFPARLLHVCRHWRDLAVNTPRLWTSFAFAFHEYRYRELPTLVSDWIRRSRSLPVSIQAQSANISYERQSLEEKSVYENLVQAVCEVSRRWDDISFEDIPASFAERIISAAQDAPLCTKFDLSVTSAPGDTPLRLPLPDILSITILSLPLIVVSGNGPFESTWEVKMDTLADADSFVQLLLSAPYLEKLSLNFIAAGLVYRGNPIKANELESMALTFELERDVAITRSVFHTVTAPSLTTLYLKEVNTSFTQAVFAKDFLARSRCPLQRFCYGNTLPGYDLGVIIDICKQTPTIKMLDIQARANHDEFRRFLDNLSDRESLPSLERFTFEILDQSNEELLIPSLRNFTEPRCQNNGGKLRELTIHKRNSLHGRNEEREADRIQFFTGLLDLEVKFTLQGFEADHIPSWHWGWMLL